MKATTLQKKIDEFLMNQQEYHKVIKFLANGETKECNNSPYCISLFIRALHALGVDYWYDYEASFNGQFAITLTSKGKSQIKDWQQGDLCMKTLHKMNKLNLQ